ncbi:MAG: hypothetical protein HY901_11285 [Deltaproteobacteria bacterium]|nr:hypothetical protein [Deltaproteobacteria bacterium]
MAIAYGVGLTVAGGCAKSFEELAPFPCSGDLQCPGGFTCERDAGMCLPTPAAGRDAAVPGDDAAGINFGDAATSGSRDAATSGPPDAGPWTNPHCESMQFETGRNLTVTCNGSVIDFSTGYFTGGYMVSWSDVFCENPYLFALDNGQGVLLEFLACRNDKECPQSIVDVCAWPDCPYSIWIVDQSDRMLGVVDLGLTGILTVDGYVVGRERPELSFGCVGDGGCSLPGDEPDGGGPKSSCTISGTFRERAVHY